MIMEENIIPSLGVGEGCWPWIQRAVERPIQPEGGDQAAWLKYLSPPRAVALIQSLPVEPVVPPPMECCPSPVINPGYTVWVDLTPFQTRSRPTPSRPADTGSPPSWGPQHLQPSGEPQDFDPGEGKPMSFVPEEAKGLGVWWGTLPFPQPLSAAGPAGASGGPVVSSQPGVSAICVPGAQGGPSPCHPQLIQQQSPLPSPGGQAQPALHS